MWYVLFAAIMSIVTTARKTGVRGNVFASFFTLYVKLSYPRKSVIVQQVGASTTVKI